jgi:hypothetical protein
MERETRGEKTTYAVCGTVMIVTAALLRLIAEGDLMLVGLFAIGLATLAASADRKVVSQ